MAYNFGCRPPPGGRGLKSQALYRAESVLSSSSTRGTWIEIHPPRQSAPRQLVVLHPGDVD